MAQRNEQLQNQNQEELENMESMILKEIATI